MTYLSAFSILLTSLKAPGRSRVEPQPAKEGNRILLLGERLSSQEGKCLSLPSFLPISEEIKVMIA